MDGVAIHDDRSNDQVRESILRLHRRLCADHRELLAEVAEHDRRQAWQERGASGEDSFLVAELDLAWSTARDWVRVAHALDRHPALGDSFADGEISFDQLGPLVQVMSIEHPGTDNPAGPFDDDTPPPIPPEPDDPAEGAAGADDNAPDRPTPEPGPDRPDPTPDPTPDPAAEALALAGRLSAGQLAARARLLRRRSQAEAAAAHRRRHFRVIDIDGGVGVHVDGDLFDDAAAILRAAMLDYTRSLTPDPETGRYEPVEHSFADALVEMASAWLEGRERHTGRAVVFFHADARVLTGEDGWAESEFGPIAAETVRRMACYCHLLICADTPDGDPLHLGRSQRTPTWQLGETVRRRDGGCRFPGCRRTRWTNAHHIREWDAHHGLTDIENLCTLCRRHHRLVHEGGWTVTGDPAQQLTFTSPTGTITLTSWPNDARRPSDPPPDQHDAARHREAVSYDRGFGEDSFGDDRWRRPVRRCSPR